MRQLGGHAPPSPCIRLTANHGYVRVGDCRDTPRFAVEAIVNWWCAEGVWAYPDAQELLILADAGDSNSARSRVWQAQLQAQLCDVYGLTVTVCHYPTGCSKWNLIEHRSSAGSAASRSASCAAARFSKSGS